MRDVSVELAKTLKTKQVFNVFVRGKDSRVAAKEKFNNGTIKWYPFYVNPRDSKVVRKYTNIKYIGTRNNKFPKTGFSNNATTGFGFTNAQGVNSFFRFIDKNPKVKAIVFTDAPTALKKDGVLELNFSDFGKIQARAKSFFNGKRSEEANLVQNTFHELLPKEYKEPTKLMLFAGTLERYLGKYALDNFDISDEEAKLLKSILLGSGLSSELVVSTKREIERVYIEDVLGQFKELMKFKSDSKNLEERWHRFFKEHTWIFSQIFAFPAVYFDNKVNVGGQDFSGNTDKIVDFLYKNEFTNNLAFIEIKTHKTKLMNGTPYRKPDIYSVSKDVTGSIVQVLDQRTRLLKNFNAKKNTAEIESLNSSCLVVIGSLKMLRSKAKRDSFELFRSGNRDVILVTFDELLKKITTLLEIFTKKPSP